MEKFTVLIVYWVGAISIFLVALFIRKFKAYDLIAGYNTMSPEEKANFDVEGASKLFWIFACVMAPITICFGILNFYLTNNSFITAAYLSILFFGIAILVITINKSHWTRKKLTRFIFFYTCFSIAMVALAFL